MTEYAGNIEVEWLIGLAYENQCSVQMRCESKLPVNINDVAVEAALSHRFNRIPSTNAQADDICLQH